MRTERAINRPLPQAVLTVLGTASAEDEDGKHETQTCPRRHHFSERCKPLRQPPAERSFSSIPPKWNPVRNDRVLPLLETERNHGNCGFSAKSIEVFKGFAGSYQFERWKSVRSSGTVKKTNFVTLTVTVFVI